MSDTNEFDTSVSDDAGPGVLRQKLEQALAVLRTKEKELADLRTAESQRSVKQTWDELAVPDAIRKLYKGEETAEAIASWWNDSKALFNVQAAEEQPQALQPTEAELAQQQAAQQFQEASGLGTNGLQSGFDAVMREAEQAAQAYKAGTMSRADFDAAKARVHEGMHTPTH